MARNNNALFKEMLKRRKLGGHQPTLNKRIKKIKVNKNVPRINDYCGVITESQLESL